MLANKTVVLKKTIQIVILIFSSLLLLKCHSSPDGFYADDKPFYLSEYKGKWVIVNYWAPWCEHCLKEIAILNELHANHSDKLLVLGVSFDELPSKDIKAFAKAHQVFFPLLKQFSKEKWNINTMDIIPMSLVFSPNQQLIEILKGPQTLESLLKVIQQYPTPFSARQSVR